jgi:hypothetical protein
MEEWKNGNIEVTYAETAVNKGFQETVNEMCFIKNKLSHFHTSILPYLCMIIPNFYLSA